MLVDPLWSTRRFKLFRYVALFINILFLVFILFLNLDNFGVSTPVTPKKNMRAFGGSGAAASSEWYDAKLQNCIDFDKAGTSFCYQTVLAMLIMRLYFQFLSMMLQKRLSALTETPLLGCLPFPCTRDLVGLPTYLSTLWYRFFLPCPPTPKVGLCTARLGLKAPALAWPEPALAL